MTDRLISVRIAQNWLGCSNGTIYKIIHSKDFPRLYKRNDKSFCFYESEFREWCKRNGYALGKEM